VICFIWYLPVSNNTCTRIDIHNYTILYTLLLLSSTSSIKHLLPALHTRHGLNVLTPVAHLCRHNLTKQKCSVQLYPETENVLPLFRLIPKKLLKITHFCSISASLSICKVLYTLLVVFCVYTFSCLMSSFLTDLRLALRSMEPLCLEPSSALIISSADTRTFLRAGFLNFPPKSCTFSFSSWIFYTDTHTLTLCILQKHLV